MSKCAVVGCGADRIPLWALCEKHLGAPWSTPLDELRSDLADESARLAEVRRDLGERLACVVVGVALLGVISPLIAWLFS